MKLEEVEKAIRAARSEVPQYARHLRARRGWEDIEPLVVVFHTAIEDVSWVEDDETILINIGSRSPSRLEVDLDRGERLPLKKIGTAERRIPM